MKRTCVLIALLAIIQFGTLYIRAGYTPPDVIPVANVFESIPRTIDEWSSTNVDLDPKLYLAIGASETLDRRYSPLYGSPVLFHCSGWNDADEWLPHPPTGCYTAAGWEIKQKRTITLGDFPQSPISFLELERQGERVGVIYWYQRGPFVYHGREGARFARQELWGKAQWPPLVKVLLQTSALDSKAAEKRLRTLATRIMQSIHPG